MVDRMPDEAAVKRGRNNKRRGNAWELKVAKRMGGHRHPADTGGDEDVQHNLFSVQCRERHALADWILKGLDKARANTEGKPGVLAVRLARGRGVPARTLVVMDFEEFCDWEGLGPPATEEQLAEWAERWKSEVPTESLVAAAKLIGIDIDPEDNEWMNTLLGTPKEASGE